VSGIGGAFQFAGEREGLAGVAAAQHVDRAVLPEGAQPVDEAQVAEVGHAGHAVGDDLAGAWVDVGHPGEFAAEHLLYGLVKSAVASAYGASPERHRPAAS
jgi:hypothetical protein